MRIPGTTAGISASALFVLAGALGSTPAIVCAHGESCDVIRMGC